MKIEHHARALASHDRALAALAGGDADAALSHIRDALRLTPGDTEIRITEARIHLRRLDAPRALAALEAIAMYAPADARRLDVMELRAHALIEMGRDEDALPLLEELIRQCPGDATLCRLAAGAAGRLGESEREIAHLAQAVKLDPDDAATARHLARLLAASDPQASIALMRGDAASVGARWQATRWMVDAGRDADAEESYRALLKLMPDDPQLWLEAGDHAERAGSHKTAVTRYAQSLRLSPRQVEVIAAMARSFMHAGAFEKAAWQWFKLTRLSPESVNAWAALAVCGLSADRPGITDRAEQRLATLADEAARMEALADAWLHAASGDVLRQATRGEERTVVTASPLTWILQRSAEVLEAQSERRPDWADTHYHTAVCRAALGDADEARHHVQAALDINPNYRAATTLAASLPKAA